MPLRTPKQTIVVVRDKKSVTPPLGEPFEFTDEEVKQIEAMNPDAISAEATVDLTKTDDKKADAKKPATGPTETL